MLRTLTEFFESLVAPSPASAPQAAAHALQLATAVMLVEVMRADATFAAEERAAVLAALRVKFGLTEDEAQRLAELAEAAARQASDLFAFTSRIDEAFSMEQKIQMVELLWQVAYADGHLAAHERQVMWRIADLLHVPQGAYVHARLRAAWPIRCTAAGSSRPCST